jgi:HSP20 family protein
LLLPLVDPTSRTHSIIIQEKKMANTTVAKSHPTQADVELTRDVPVYRPRFDIVETDDELTLYGDMPGVEESQLDVRYENEQLIIHGKISARAEGVKFLRQEYGIGDFHRTFLIGESVNAAKIAAEVHNGVLVVHLPKAEAAKPKRIQVRAVEHV